MDSALATYLKALLHQRPKFCFQSEIERPSDTKTLDIFSMLFVTLEISWHLKGLSTSKVRL
jgi:hypothetical protein